MPVGKQELAPSWPFGRLGTIQQDSSVVQGTGAGCRMRVFGSNECGATELPRKQGSDPPVKVREGFLEERDFLLSLRRVGRIQQQKEVKAR